MVAGTGGVGRVQQKMRVVVLDIFPTSQIMKVGYLTNDHTRQKQQLHSFFLDDQSVALSTFPPGLGLERSVLLAQ